MSTSSVRIKPQACRRCENHGDCSGFAVPYGDPKKAKILIWLEAAGETEADESSPLVGTVGKQFFGFVRRKFGLVRQDFAIDNTIRCRPPGNKFPEHRTGAISRCRRWDYLIAEYKPTYVCIMVHPSFAFNRNPGYLTFLEVSIKEALEKREKGERPMILFGKQSMKALFPLGKEDGADFMKYVGGWFPVKASFTSQHLEDFVQIKEEIKNWENGTEPEDDYDPIEELFKDDDDVPF